MSVAERGGRRRDHGLLPMRGKRPDTSGVQGTGEGSSALTGNSVWTWKDETIPFFPHSALGCEEPGSGLCCLEMLLLLERPRRALWGSPRHWILGVRGNAGTGMENPRTLQNAWLRSSGAKATERGKPPPLPPKSLVVPRKHHLTASRLKGEQVLHSSPAP